MRVDYFLENVLDDNNKIEVCIRKENRDGTYTKVAKFTGCDEAYIEYGGKEEVKSFTLDVETMFLQITI